MIENRPLPSSLSKTIRAPPAILKNVLQFGAEVLVQQSVVVENQQRAHAPFLGVEEEVSHG
jgi:hypothetical protein